METLIIALAAGFGFILAYHTYGKWLGKKVFRLYEKDPRPLNGGPSIQVKNQWTITGMHPKRQLLQVGLRR